MMEGLAVLSEQPTVTGAEIAREIQLQSGIVEVSEPERILAALEANAWNASAAARGLGVGRTTLYRKMTQFSLRRPSVESA